MYEIEYSPICTDQRGPIGLGWERAPGTSTTCWRRDVRWRRGYGFVASDDSCGPDEMEAPCPPCLTAEESIDDWFSNHLERWQERQDPPVGEEAQPDALYVHRVVPSRILERQKGRAEGLLEDIGDDEGSDTNDYLKLPMTGPNA